MKLQREKTSGGMLRGIRLLQKAFSFYIDAVFPKKPDEDCSHNKYYKVEEKE